VADRMFVMYAGHVVESGPIDVLSRPKLDFIHLIDRTEKAG
jgi:ABC-type dipeptide/oligopeptide/nickel transport system ATPase component